MTQRFVPKSEPQTEFSPTSVVGSVVPTLSGVSSGASAMTLVLMEVAEKLSRPPQSNEVFLRVSRSGLCACSTNASPKTFPSAGRLRTLLGVSVCDRCVSCDGLASGIPASGLGSAGIDSNTL